MYYENIFTKDFKVFVVLHSYMNDTIKRLTNKVNSIGKVSFHFDKFYKLVY